MTPLPDGPLTWLELSEYLSIIVIEFGDCGKRAGSINQE